MALTTSEIIFQYVCPALGMMTGNIMFTAPFRAVLRASREGRLGDLNPTPWAFTTGNTLGWMCYSFITYNLWLFFGNAPGFCLSIWFNMEALKLEYENFRLKETKASIIIALEEQSRFLRSSVILDNSNGDESTSNNNNLQLIQERTMKQQPQESAAARAALPSSPSSRREVAADYVKHVWDNTHQGGEAALDYAKIVGDVVAQNTKAPVGHEYLVLMNVVAWVIIISIIIFARSFTMETRQFIVGVAGNANLVFFYGAPLSTIFTVLKTRSSATIHRWTMIANTFNGYVWAAFGFSILDYFIAAPNAIGALLGTIQIVLCILFPRPRNDNNNNKKKDLVEEDENYGGVDVENNNNSNDDGHSEVSSMISKGESGSLTGIMEAFQDEIDVAVKRRGQEQQQRHHDNHDNNSQDSPTSISTFDRFWFM